MEYQVFPKWNSLFVTYCTATIWRLGIVCLVMWKHMNDDIMRGDNARYSIVEYIEWVAETSTISRVE